MHLQVPTYVPTYIAIVKVLTGQHTEICNHLDTRSDQKQLLDLFMQYEYLPTYRIRQDQRNRIRTVFINKRELVCVK